MSWRDGDAAAAQNRTPKPFLVFVDYVEDRVRSRGLSVMLLTIMFLLRECETGTIYTARSLSHLIPVESFDTKDTCVPRTFSSPLPLLFSLLASTAGMPAPCLQ